MSLPKLSVLQQRLAASAGIMLVLAIIHIPAFNQAVFQCPAMLRLDTAAHEYLDDGMTKAAAAFATARAANAVISLLQSAEVEAGAGFIFHGQVILGIGQVVDPVNDLVERFSWVMLASLTSLGIQKFLLEIAPWACVDILLSIALVTLLGSVWLSNRRMGLYGRSLALRVILAAIVLRLLVPAATIANEYVYDRFLSPQHDAAAAQVETFRQNMEADLETKEKGPLKTLDRLGTMLDDFTERISGFADHVFQLLLVFVIQTAVLPLATLYLLLRCVRWIMGRRDRFDVEQRWWDTIRGPEAP